jgi:hypothetical protein
MSAPISLTQTQIFTALRSVLTTFGLTSSTACQDVPIIRGQMNRVPEPKETDFVVLWPVMRNRLAMNVDSWIDSQVTGSLSGLVLTVTTVTAGSVLSGATIYGAGVPTACQVVVQLSGTTGGIGTYSTSIAASVASEPLFVGTQSAMQETEVTIQADVHGPAAADNAARIATLFRDQFGVTAFLAQGVALAPLYTSDPRQLPFENGEQQLEERWTIDLVMQANVTVTTTQQFADALNLTLQEVDE